MPDVSPIEVSRITLFGLVAAGTVIAIATSGPVAPFGAGFAVGAGAVLVLSRAMRPRAAEEPPADEGGAEP